ncbi:extracellular solute-binding protein [Shinella yambaruensis]|uniref:ABC transporter substrate-binding protein n=1 Tax=Shinella yambaruensis TaxID=415996 RepID=UPI003D7AF9EA
MTMTVTMKALLSGAMLMALATTAQAACGIEKGSIRILGNDFPAIQAVTAAAATCRSDTVQFKVNLTQDHESLAVAALKAKPAEYTSQIVASSSILPLLNDGLIRPLDDYVAKDGAGLKKTQLITINGKVMAVAFMANAQHLFYREDILKAAGVEPPKTYEEVLAAAKAIKDKGLVKYPFGGTYKAGWDLGEEFVNMYIGMGGTFFKEGSAEPAINNEKGVAALEMMKALSAYMNPDYLTFDSNALQAEFEAGNVAMANFWGSRAGAVTDGEGSKPEITGNIKFAAAPTVAGGTIPATTLWWDGFTLATNISDDDAAATFKALASGVTKEVANANTDKAVWLADGFNPGPLAQGTLESANAGALPYPMEPYMGLMHTALGNGLAEFMQGKEDAAKALSDVEATYSAAAQAAGFLK